MPHLRGARIHVRALGLDDGPAFIAAARASRELHGAWVHPPATLDAFVKRMGRTKDDDRLVSLVAARNDDGALVGVLNLSEIIRGPLQQAYLGYYAFAPHAGRGYMREALALVLRHAFTALKLHRIEANIQPGNVASQRLAEGAGFTREGFSPRYLKIGGRWRDHERWAINAEQWQALRRSARPG